MSDMKIDAGSQFSKPMSEVVQTSGAQTIAGAKTFSNPVTVGGGLSATSAIDHFVGSKNVCQMTAEGAENLVLAFTGLAANVATEATEAGIKPFKAASTRGIEFRVAAAIIKQIKVATGASGSWAHRDTQDGGTTWTAYFTILDSNNTGWV